MLCKVMNKNKKYITVSEAAKMLCVNPETLRRWDRAGKLKAKRHPINNYRIYHISDIKRIEKYLSE